MVQTVLITGGSRGIGYATAGLFAERGWNVALCSRDAEQAAEAAKTVAQETKNANVLGIGADIGDATAIQRLFAEVTKRFPTLDALVNNAGVFHGGSPFDLSDHAFEEMMRINVTGMAQCCREAFKHMKKKGGSIVNISSLAGIPGTQKFPGFWA